MLAVAHEGGAVGSLEFARGEVSANPHQGLSKYGAGLVDWRTFSRTEEWRLRVASALTKVRYRPAIAGAKRRCNHCINYQEAESGCTMVEGSIKPNFVCNLWKFKTPTTLKEMQGEGPG